MREELQQLIDRTYTLLPTLAHAPNLQQSLLNIVFATIYNVAYNKGRIDESLDVANDLLQGLESE
jgi:hypothetical protein